METYWSEVKSIEEEEGEEEEREEERKNMDEAELEEAWLKEAGLSFLVTGSPPGEEPAEALLSTLTQRQVATVTQRLESYKQTMKKSRVTTHIRDVFITPAETGPSVRYSRTRTIHRTRVRPAFPDFQLFQDKLSEQDTHTATHTHSPPDTAAHTHSPPDTATHTATHTHSPPDTAAHTHSPPDTATHTHSPTHTATHTPTNTETHTHSPTETASHTHSSLRADWLLSDLPYSEGMAEDKESKACQDCQHLCRNETELPEFQLPAPEVLVQVPDLSSADLKQLRFFSLIELSTMFHTLKIQAKPGPRFRTRTKDSGVFGVPLTTLLDRDRKLSPGQKVPLVFMQLLCVVEECGLQTEGILRVPGSAARVKFLRAELERNFPSGHFQWAGLRQQEAVALIKLFIRELPTPLMTSQLEQYHALLGISSVHHQIQALHLLILLLPEANRDLLKALLIFLRKVVSHQHTNRMSLWNVSMVIAPNLFTCHHGNRNRRWSITRQQEEMQEAAGASQLVRLLITQQDLLWTVPCFLLCQVRMMNQVSNSWKGLLKKRNNKNDKNKVAMCDGLIRVQAPLLAKVSMAIQLDGQTRVKDVIARFQTCSTEVKLCLFEVGGNIGERCLHPDTVLMDVHRVNPQCDWILKPRPAEPVKPLKPVEPVTTAL